MTRNDEEMSKCLNDDYAKENFLGYSYHQNCYKIIGTDLSRRKNARIRNHVNFIRRLEEGNGATSST